MKTPVLDMDRLDGIPFPVATVRELRRRGMLRMEALGRGLLVLWNGGEPRVYEDACPHLGLPLSMGTLDGDRVSCRYHGWTFETDSGDVVEQPTLRRPQACRLRRWGALRLGALVFAWRGDPGASESIRRQLPEVVHDDFVVHRVMMDAPFYLALFNAVDYAHFSFHKLYSPVYAVYRRLRRDAHVPGRPFSWKLVAEDADSADIRLEEARRDLKLYPTSAEFRDDGGVNHFQTHVTPVGPSRTLYWECYRARTDNPVIQAAARAVFRAVIVPLLDTEDATWTGRSAENFLAGANIHLSATDLPLGTHLRKFVLPRTG